MSEENNVKEEKAEEVPQAEKPQEQSSEPQGAQQAEESVDGAKVEEVSTEEVKAEESKEKTKPKAKTVTKASLKNRNQPKVELKGKIVIVRVRGQTGIRGPIKDTLTMLKLRRPNYCVVYEMTPSVQGMLKKTKDYVTWGEIDDSTYKLLVEKRSDEYKGPIKDPKGKISYSSRYVEVNGKKIKPFFKLNPPVKGYGRKGIKQPFSKGGALAYRGDKINDLIKRMIQ